MFLFNTYFHVPYNLYDLSNSDSLYKLYLFLITRYYTVHIGLNRRNYMSEAWFIIFLRACACIWNVLGPEVDTVVSKHVTYFVNIGGKFGQSCMLYAWFVTN
jgi:hypothetical protein